MTTKDIIEAILYLNPNSKRMLRAIHILNDTDRNWTPKQHKEYPFIDAFKNPCYLTIINKQIHTYIIGDIFKGRTYNIINLEGFSANHMALSKTELKTHIKENVKEKVFLPDNGNERIIFIKDNKLYIFNRMGFKRDMFAKKSDWTIGTDVYSMDRKFFKTDANEILSNIFDEF